MHSDFTREDYEHAAAFATVGDRIQCDLRFPTPRTITLVLETPEAAAHANGLLADKSSGWRLLGPMHGIGKSMNGTP